jgi:hypothetical protein
MCVAAIGAMSDDSFPAIWARIPRRQRGAAVADATADFCLRRGWSYRLGPSDFLPAAGASRKFKDLVALHDPAQFLRAGGGSRSLRELASFCVKLPHYGEGVPLEAVVTAIQEAARRSGVRLDLPVTLPLEDGEMTLDDLGEQSILRWALTHHGDWMCRASDRIRHDAELCRSAIASGWCELQVIPFEVIQAHPDIAMQLMRRTEPPRGNGEEFDPLSPITQKIWALFDRATTEPLCRDILPRFGNAVESLRQLEPSLLTDDMYALAAAGGCNLDLIPQRLHPALQGVSVLKLADNLWRIPESERTLALCKRAISRDRGAWAFVPARYLCAELEERAMAVADEYLAQWIDQGGDRLPDRFLIRAVTEGGAELYLLPPRLRSPAIYRQAVQRHPSRIQDLVLTTEDWLPTLMVEMLREDGSRIRFLQADQLNPERMTLAYQHGAARDDLMAAFDKLADFGVGQAHSLMATFESVMSVPAPGAGD